MDALREARTLTACGLFTQTPGRYCNLFGPNIDVVTFFSTRHLGLHSQWLTALEIIDV